MTRSPELCAPAHTVSRTDESLSQAIAAGVIWQTADDVDYSGRQLTIGGSQLLNFGSCSYLAFEQRPELKQGAIRAIERFGTQFSFSRTYLESPLYPQLEQALSRVTGGHVLVTASTTLGHIAALPVLVEPGDAVVIDRSAHASLHTAAALLRCPVTALPHNQLAPLEAKIAELSKTHRRVWYVLDGLYSMTGDFAPLTPLAALLDTYPQLHLYVDDAHGTSWCGRHGRGHALESLGGRDRVVVALSLNKAFSAGGGALVFANDEDRMRVRRGGGPMVFSGPVQPALLGAALASAQLHLSPELPALQRALLGRIERAHALADELGITLVSRDPTPIGFVRVGPSAAAFALTKALHERGVYVSVSAFPAVPHDRAGIRFTLSLHNTLADVDRLMRTVAAELTRLGITPPRPIEASSPAE